MYQFQVERDRFADAGDDAQVCCGRPQHSTQRAKPCEQLLGQRFDVSTRHRAEQQQFHYLIVRQCRQSACHRPIPQPRAMTGIVGPRHRLRCPQVGRDGNFLDGANLRHLHNVP